MPRAKRRTSYTDTVSFRLTPETQDALARLARRYGPGTSRNRAVVLLIHAAAREIGLELPAPRPEGRPKKDARTQVPSPKA